MRIVLFMYLGQAVSLSIFIIGGQVSLFVPYYCYGEYELRIYLYDFQESFHFQPDISVLSKISCTPE